MRINSLQSDELMHFGVLGMKWGRRKDKTKSTSNKKSLGSSISRARSEYKETKRKRNIKNWSDQELASKISRLQMEKRYRDLKRDEITAGTKLIGDILNSSAKTLATQIAVNSVGSFINAKTGMNLVNTGGEKKKKKK